MPVSSRDLICLACPNGCHLTRVVLSDGTIEIRGNRCDKGITFAKSVVPKGTTGPLRFVGDRTRPVHGDDELRALLDAWGIRLRARHPGLMPAGSPERTLFRVVIEDDCGHYFVLERIPPEAFHSKMRIIRTLDCLAARGMPWIMPYLLTVAGEPIHRHGMTSWQVVPFSQGVALDRRTYFQEAWRAKVLAEFLICLKEKSADIRLFSLDEKFSLRDYIRVLAAQVAQRRPALMVRLRPVTSFLEKGLMTVHEALPSGFCHGDYHPLNIIWSTDSIVAVIDWEFTGLKPEIYDLANLTGCLGMEDPESLVGPLVTGLVGRLREAGLFADISWEHFPDFVVAMRFAWLSEWLRKNDEQMIALELDYMDLLIEHNDDLRRAWGL